MAKENFNWTSEEEAMKMLGYAKSSLRILARTPSRKTLPIRSSKLNKKTILYSKSDIENYINSKSTST